MGVAEEGIPFRDIAGLIGRRLNVPVVSKSPAAAAKQFGFLAPFVSLDNPASSQLTQERLGWKPTQIRLLADLEAGDYFAGVVADYVDRPWKLPEFSAIVEGI